jgi:Clostripain family
VLLAILILLSSLVVNSSSSALKTDKQYSSNDGIVDFSGYGNNSIKYSNDAFVKASDGKVAKLQYNMKEIDDFTLLVYIIGSNLEDNSYEATKDINEMLKSHIDNHRVNVVLETGGSKGKPDGNRTIDFSSVRRHYISNNTVHTLPQDLGPVNMGDNKTLSDFLNWGISNFPAKKYGLILWDHGAGVQGFGADDENLGTDPLHLSEILFSLYQTLRYPSVNFKNFEFIGFDSCLMGTFELASHLNTIVPNYKFSNFLIGSEEIEPNWGWNYTNIINSIYWNPEITGDALGKKIIESYVSDSNRISQENKFFANRDITLSVINLTRIPELNQRLNDIVNSTIHELKDQHSLLKLLRAIDVTESFGQTLTSSYGMIDLYEFLSNLANAFPSLKTKINAVKHEINSAVTYRYSGEAHPNANGLSIFLPLSLSDLQIIDKLFAKRYSVTNNINWLYFINSLGSIIKTDNFTPVIQSNRFGNAIDVHISDPDIQTIFISFIIQSSTGNPVLYVQNLDPNLINETGFFKYDDNRMLALCNEKLCSPVSMIMNVKKDSKKIFIPVEIQSSRTPNRKVSLVYEFRNNAFLFLGGIDENQVKGGQSIPKEKVILEQGDIITPQGLKFNDQPFFVKEPTTIKNRLKNIFNTFVRDRSLTISDPVNIKPKFVNVNQTAISIAFCDFSDHCEQTRRYYINTTNDSNHLFERIDQNQKLLLDPAGTKNSNNLVYANQKHGFQLEYPYNWLSVAVDPHVSTPSQIYLNDPNVLSLFPLEEIINSNGSAFSLMNSVSISMQERDTINPKLYFDYFNNPRTRQDLMSEFKYELSNATKTSINGHPAFEFILEREKQIPIFNEKDAKRLEYWVTLSMDGKEYTINFASEATKFYKYLPTVKKIVSSFKPFNELALHKSPDELNDGSQGITKIREIMANRLLKNIIWKEYTDPIHNFTISYPYIDILNKPVSRQLDNNIYLTSFIPPNNNFLDHPYKDPNVSIIISNNSDIIQANQLKKQAFNYEFLNSTIGNLLDGSVTTVSEHKYFLPLLYQWVYEKEAYARINDKSISVSLVAPYSNYILYERMFDNVLKSFKILNKR